MKLVFKWKIYDKNLKNIYNARTTLYIKSLFEGGSNIIALEI